MSAKPNVEELDAKLDFNLINKNLTNLIETGKLPRRKRMADLLDKVKDALLRARAAGASFAALAATLKDQGLPVTEPTLRKYLNDQTHSNRTRKRKSTIGSNEAVVKAKTAPGSALLKKVSHPL
jgi:hypothetical protein